MLSGDLGRRRRGGARRRAKAALAEIGLTVLRAGAADARRDVRQRGGGAGGDRAARRSSGSSTARASRSTAGRRGARLHPQPQRRHGPRSRGRRRRARSLPVDTVVLDGEAIGFGDDGWPRRLPGHDEPLRDRADADEADAARPRARSSSTCCTSTATTCSTGPLAERLDVLDGARRRVARARRSRPTTPTVAEAFLDGRARRRARGRDGEGARLGLRGRAAGRGVAQGQAGAARSISSCSPPSGATGGARGWLSNLHLGARDPDGGEFVMVGKTFKGLTDQLLTWQTDALLARERAPRRRHRRDVRPELVVEIALDGVQVSTPLPGRGGAAVRAGARLPPRQGRRSTPTRSTPSAASCEGSEVVVRQAGRRRVMAIAATTIAAPAMQSIQ